jgi:hypothetical protein
MVGAQALSRTGVPHKPSTEPTNSESFGDWVRTYTFYLKNIQEIAKNSGKRIVHDHSI